jgi:hypothetical protein
MSLLYLCQKNIFNLLQNYQVKSIKKKRIKQPTNK